MDYKDKYDKLVNAIKVLRETNPSDEGIQNWVNDNVPELREPEDERIRKALIEFFESQDDNTTYSLVPKKDILAWLEKQGQWTEADDEELEIAINTLKDAGQYDSADWLITLKQRIGK